VIAAPPPPPARVQVVAREFRFSLSRLRVPAGAVVIELVNAGQDAHDLKLRRAGGTRVVSWPTLRPGAHRDRELRLRPGRYSLWCGLPGHRALGMQAVLVVTKPPRRRG
jgi:plastocyanin